MWNVEIVENTDMLDMDTSISLDSNERPCISYFGRSTDEIIFRYSLKYAKKINSDWDIDTLIYEGYFVHYVSLAIDTKDRPHISCTANTLKHFNWTGKNWNMDIVDGESTYCNNHREVSMVLDSNDYPHISYYAGNLRYAKWNGTSWNITIIDPDYHSGKFSSLALDTFDNPHIIYWVGNNYSGLSYKMRYAKLIGPEWRVETLDSNEKIDGGMSMTLDSLNMPHISYNTVGERRPLNYAKLTEKGWMHEEIDTCGYFGGYSSIKLDLKENPHISYYDYDRGGLKYAKTINGKWETKLVDTQCDRADYTSIVIDSFDRPHISYSDGQYLKYARLILGIPGSQGNVEVNDKRQINHFNIWQILIISILIAISICMVFLKIIMKN
jgi:hypothetical protein